MRSIPTKMKTTLKILNMLRLRVKATTRTWLPAAAAIGVSLAGTLTSLALPQGFLPSAAGMTPITTLTTYSSSNLTANVVVETQPMQLAIALPLTNQDVLSNLLQ